MNWLLRVLTWDGLLPAVVWAIPAILFRVLPDGELLVVTLGVLLPIVALLIRFYAGYRMIEANHCSPAFRHVQRVSLCVGVFVLLLLDSLLITLLSLDLDGRGHRGADWRVQAAVFALLYVPYLLCLSVAMYPGRLTAQPVAADEWSTSSKKTLISSDS